MIKNHYLITGILLLSVSRELYCIKEKSNESFTKNKILVLTSFGGGGNFEASKAMETYLNNDYNVQLCHAFKEILAPLDPFNFLTCEHYSGEEVYNAFLPGKHFQLLGWMYQFGRWYIQSQKERIIPLLRDYFITTKPDLIISVIPVINNIVLEVAQELTIPFLLIPTDLDVTPYIVNIINPTYKQFYLGLPFAEPDIMIPIQAAHITPDHIHILGAPLRPAFFAQHNKSYLQQYYGIDESKPVIMLLMGSQGSDEIKNYTDQLLTINKPFHLLVCIGKNEKSRNDLSELSIPAHVSMSTIGFTKNIADYMALSDLLITKSGTLSVCEALYMDLPLFLDATSTLLPWEKFNHHFIKKHTFGMSISQYDDIAPLVTNVIENRDELTMYKYNIQKLEKKTFSQEFKELVKKILSK